MCHDQRRYTPSTIAEMQRIALVVELRRRMAARTMGWGGSLYQDGFCDGMALVRQWLDELEPVCDDPGKPTLADVTVIE